MKNGTYIYKNVRIYHPTTITITIININTNHWWRSWSWFMMRQTEQEIFFYCFIYLIVVDAIIILWTVFLALQFSSVAYTRWNNNCQNSLESKKSNSSAAVVVTSTHKIHILGDSFVFFFLFISHTFILFLSPKRINFLNFVCISFIFIFFE